MMCNRFGLATLFVLLAIGCPLRACADTPVADPGFPFIDVNGDGKYSVSDGDIGLTSTPSVDVKALILNNGNFNTQVSQGAYHAPWRSVSLVIPPSVSLTLTAPLNLQAGKNLLVYGTLQAPSISLAAYNNVDLTTSTNTYSTTMNVSAGSIATLDGATVTGTGSNSSLGVNAGGNISAQLVPSNGYVTSVLTFGQVAFNAGSNINMNGAALTALGSTSTINIAAQGSIQAVGFATLTSGGSLTLSTGWCSNRSPGGCNNPPGGCNNPPGDYNNPPGDCNHPSNGGDNRSSDDCAQPPSGNCNNPPSDQCPGGWSSSHNITLQGDSLAGSPVKLCSSGNIDMTGTAIASSGSVSVLAWGTVTGNSLLTAIDASGVSVSALTGIDLSQSALLSYTNPISLLACTGPISIAGASITSTGGLQAHARQNISAANSGSHIDHSMTLTSDCGQIDITGSTVVPATSSATDTYIKVVAPGNILANNANWTVPVSVTLDSIYSNITARAAALKATASGGTINLLAGGLQIDVTGATFTGSVTYGPTNVSVTGP